MKNTRNRVLWILVALLSLGQLQRIELSLFSHTSTVYFHDIFVLIWIFHVFFTKPYSFLEFIWQFFTTRKKLSVFAGITVISTLISMLNSGDSIAVLYFLRLASYLIFGFSLSFLVTTKELLPKYLSFQALSVGLIALFLGFLQYALIPDTRFLAILGWDDHYRRLIGSYFDPGFTGALFLLGLLLGLSNPYINTMKSKIALTLSFSLGIILTFSRATYLAGLLSFMLLAGHSFLEQRRQKTFNTQLAKLFTPVVFTLCAGVVLLWGVFTFGVKQTRSEGVNLLRTASIQARIRAIQQQVSLITPQTLVIGNGVFSAKNSLVSPETALQNSIPSHSRLPDNLFMNVLLSTGVFGLGVFLFALVETGQELYAKNRYLGTAFVALIAHSQFSNSLLYPFLLLLFLIWNAGVVSTRAHSLKAK